MNLFRLLVELALSCASRLLCYWVETGVCSSYLRPSPRTFCDSRRLLLPAEATAVLFSASRRCVFFSVNTITHEPMHLVWWHFARTCTLTTSRTLLNTKVKSHVTCFVCAWSCLNQSAWIHEMLHRHGPRAVLSLEQRLTLTFTYLSVG